MATDKFAWIAQRTYTTRSHGIGQGRSVLVSVGPPRKLTPTERPFNSAMDEYGCTVQTGAEFTRRVVCGRDPLEALFHSLLAIEMFLVSASRKAELFDEGGQIFAASTDGFLSGPIAKEYLNELGKSAI